MIAKFLVVLAVAVTTNAGVLPFATGPAALVAPAPAVAPVAAAYAIAPFASSYSAHAVNHAVAEPVYAPAPVVAPAGFVAPAAAPLIASPAAPVVAAARYLSSPYYF